MGRGTDYGTDVTGDRDLRDKMGRGADDATGLRTGDGRRTFRTGGGQTHGTSGRGDIRSPALVSERRLAEERPTVLDVLWRRRSCGVLGTSRRNREGRMGCRRGPGGVLRVFRSLLGFS